jgi:hypothetical protein
MKFDRSKAFPYPVLRPYSDDYLDVEFQALAEFTIDDNEICIACSYITSAEELECQIGLGNACFVSVISCRETYFRQVIKSNTHSAALTLNPDALRGEVLIESYIVATKIINGFSSKYINAEFGKESFDFSPGHVLAQEEAQAIYVGRDLYKPISSVFELVKNESLQYAEWRVSLDQEHVQIEVSKAMKEAIDSARNSAAAKSILINSIYFSAVVHVLQELREHGEREYKWSKVITRQLHNHHLNIETTHAYILAQRLMKLPLGHLATYVFAKASNE